MARVRYSLHWLARTLTIELLTLKRLAKEIPAHYRFRQIPKKNGGVRDIEPPSGLLKHVQQQIKNEILRKKPFRSCVHGSAPGKSPHTNALAHVHHGVLVNIDIRNFFPSVSYRVIYHIWCDEFDCGPDVASLLTRLTTHKGRLPQGAPTSSYLANWVLSPVDDVIEARAHALDVTYTRFVDDISLSGPRAPELIQLVIDQLHRFGYAVSHRKIKVMGGQSAQQVTGYAVCGLSPSVPNLKRQQLLADIRDFSVKGGGSTDVKLLKSLNGRIAHVARTNAGAARRFERSLETRSSQDATRRCPGK